MRKFKINLPQPPKNIIGRSLMAGSMIALGGLANILCRYYIPDGIGKILGSLLFSIGLLFVINQEYLLFTGLVRNFFNKEKRFHWVYYIVVILGNFIGAIYIAIIASGCFPKELLYSALSFLEAKSLTYTISLSIICGFCITLSVLGFEKGKERGLSSTLLVIFPVVIFVFVGADHCIANMFYTSLYHIVVGGTEPFFYYLFVLIAIFGNIIGGLIPVVLKEKED